MTIGGIFPILIPGYPRLDKTIPVIQITIHYLPITFLTIRRVRCVVVVNFT